MANGKIPQQKVVTRVPCYRAPFYFAPQYLATATAWQEAFRALAEDVLSKERDDFGRVLEVDGYSIEVGWQDIELTIDARYGKFDVCEHDDRDDDDGDMDWEDLIWSGFDGEPAAFLDELKTDLVPEKWRTIVRNQVAPFAEAIWRRMTWRYEEALRQGLAEIQAQELSPLPTTPFVRVDPISRPHFPLVPKERDLQSQDSCNELDEARHKATGVMLYNVGVVPAVLDGIERPDTTQNDGRRKIDWKTVEPVILARYRDIKQNPARSVSGLAKRVTEELGSRAPKSTALTARIKKIIPNF